LDPATGAIKTWPSPSGPASHPYAIEVVDDVIWYNESNQRPDALVRFDPKTETFQSWAIPSGVGIIRHMRATPEGNLVIHQSSTNTVGLVTIGKEQS
jgi:virginiamycin B lyase